MTNNMKKGKTDKSIGRVLFTGYDKKMIMNVMEFIGQGYKMEKCGPTMAELTESLRSFRPHVVVICLMDETREKMRNYDILRDDPRYRELQVIGIGHEEDCDRLRSCVIIRNLEIFSRPLDHERLSRSLKIDVDLAKESGIWNDEKKNLEELSKVNEDNVLEEQAEERALIRKIQGVSLFQGRKSILVVDDDVQMLNVIKLYLQDLYDVTVVPSGKLALKFISKKATDLVLLDYMMPEMDGPAVLQEIRENSNYPNVPVIFLTGVSDKEKVMRSLALHPSGYLLKPVSRKVLIERVTEILLDL